MDINDALSETEALSNSFDFDKMCDGVSFSSDEMKVEHYKTRVVIVSEDDIPTPTKEQLCALKQRLGLNYVRSDVNGGETTAFVYEVKPSLNDFAGIISSVGPGWRSGEEVFEMRAKGVKLIGDSGLLHLTNMTILGTALAMNTTVTTAMAPWPVRCPT